MLNSKAKKELSSKDYTFLEDLVARGVTNMTQAEKAHVVARREYLAEEVLKEMDIDKLAEESSGNSAQVSPYASMNMNELKALCKDRGIVGATKKLEMIEALDKDDKGELEDEDEEVEEEEEK